MPESDIEKVEESFIDEKSSEASGSQYAIDEEAERRCVLFAALALELKAERSVGW